MTQINPALENMLADIPGYYDALRKAVASGDYSEIEARLNKLIESDTHMKGFDGEEGTKYYKPFHRVVAGKIMEALKRDLPTGRIPTIRITFGDIDREREKLGYEKYGSQQDVLYGFTSERYKHWGPSLNGMGFRSACMAGEAEAYLTMAPRYLPLKETPDQTTEEIGGGISSDFLQTMGVVFGNPYLNIIEEINGLRTDADPVIMPNIKVRKNETAKNLLSFIGQLIMRKKFVGVGLIKAEFLFAELKSELDKPKPALNKFYRKEQRVSQEQIGLKYADEGKYLQKLLGGARVEHLQSNVKMVKNPLRGNKCEVDSIYRVLAEKRIVLLEAKGKDSVSRGQVYQLYETFKLKLPSDWIISVVVLMIGKLKGEHDTTIDMVEVKFDDQFFGQITESLCAMKAKTHYRWRIKQPAKS